MSQALNDGGRGEARKSAKGNISRRELVKTAVAAAAAAAAIPLEPLAGGKQSHVEASVVGFDPASRAQASLNYRTSMANAENLNIGELPDNGDAARFPDFSALYSKALAHDGLGVPNASSYNSFETALSTGSFADFQNIIVGTPGGGPNSRENGPEGAFAFDLEGRDSHAMAIPPAPSVTSAETAANFHSRSRHRICFVDGFSRVTAMCRVHTSPSFWCSQPFWAHSLSASSFKPFCLQGTAEPTL